MKNLLKSILFLFVSCIISMPSFSLALNESNDFDLPCYYLMGNHEKNEPYKNNLIYTGNTVKSLTQFFCENIYEMQCSDLSDGEMSVDYFDANQSIFLSILCDSVGRGSYFQITGSYLKKKNFLDFGIVKSSTGYTEDCHSYGTMNSCDYGYNIPLIFNKIMNDFFGIKQARNLGIDKLDDDFSGQDIANKFSIEKIPGIGLQVQDGLSKGICDPNAQYYKDTCQTLKSYMVDANNLLKNTEVINIKNLQEYSGFDCENNFENNILYCGLLGQNSNYKFINAIYNEYFWYKLFLSYYSFYIDGYNFIDDSTIEPLDRLQINKEKISLVQDQVLKSKQAISISLQTLSEISYSFPIHIGFLMYQEDAKIFTKNFSKIYAPMRTLYDKLRNVQIKES